MGKEIILKSVIIPQVQRKEKNPDEIYIAGVASSGQEFEAFSKLIAHLPSGLNNLAVVILSPVDSDFRNRLTELLDSKGNFKMTRIKSGVRLESNRIYFTSRGGTISFSKNTLKVSKSSGRLNNINSADKFLSSLALEKEDKAIGIILSGNGADGVEGIKKIRACGGVTIVQEPESALNASKPLAVIETGCADIVIPADEIGEEIKAIIPVNAAETVAEVPEIKSKQALSRILKFIQDKKGVDLSGYKPEIISRRIIKRISKLHLHNYKEYLSFAENNSLELDLLFDQVLIGVTSFFRDKEVFDEIRVYLSKLMQSKGPDEEIRIWVPGCATGEEAYSLAIIVSGILGNNRNKHKVSIIASDISEKAISFAKKATYPRASIENISSEILEKYFTYSKGKYKVNESVRSMVSFFINDVTLLTPFNELDVISCRNLLMYFKTPLQKSVMRKFFRVLNSGGYLLLGKSESVGLLSNKFISIDNSNKIYQVRK